MTTKINKEDIKAIECRFAVYCEPVDGGKDDLHVVKEIVHLKDGTTKPNLRLIKNFKRIFAVTKPAARNHKDKKTWEKIDNLSMYEATQRNLAWEASTVLGMFPPRNELNRVADSPYLYGTDIQSTAIVKKKYQTTYPDAFTPASVAVLDFETDVLHGTDEIIMGTLSFGSNVTTIIHRRCFQRIQSTDNEITDKLLELLNKYLGKFVEDRKINWDVRIVDNEIDIVTGVINKAHELSPDFVAIWNINFDMPKMLKSIERAGLRPEDIFSDPSIPENYKFFRYKVGASQKVTSSGKITPVKPADRWHTAYCPSSFYFIDAMCVYYRIRNQEGDDPSYALDAILKKEFKDKPEIRKLKFEEASQYTGLEWHQVMQYQYPLEYAIYNVFDCVSMELLDEKTSDISITLPLYAGVSDYDKFKSEPRRLVDDLHYYCLDNGYVIGTTPKTMEDELDDGVVDMDGWIVMLPSHLVADNGLKIIDENDHLVGNIRVHTADLDIAGAYPNNQVVCNVSKETTKKELTEIEGVSEAIKRMQGINLSAGHTNAVEIMCDLFKAPTLDTLLDDFKLQIALSN